MPSALTPEQRERLRNTLRTHIDSDLRVLLADSEALEASLAAAEAQVARLREALEALCSSIEVHAQNDDDKHRCRVCEDFAMYGRDALRDTAPDAERGER